MFVFIFVSQLPSCIWRKFLFKLLLQVSLKKGRVNTQKSKIFLWFKNKLFPQKYGLVKLFCRCSALPHCFIVWVFFNNSRESDPKIPRTHQWQISSVLFQEMLWSNPGLFQMQFQLPKIYTYPVCLCLLWSVSAVISLSFISFLINRAKSKKGRKTGPGYIFPVALYRLSV